MKKIDVVWKNFRGAWVVYGAIGIRQYYGYSKQESMRRYRQECDEKVILEVRK